MPLFQQGDVMSSFTGLAGAKNGLGVAPDDTIWVVGGPDKILHVDQTGSVIGSVATPSNDPRGLGVDSTGCLWHADSCMTAIIKIDPSTGPTNTSFSSPSDIPTGVGLDAGDSIWHADASADKIFKFDQAGTKATDFPSPSGGPRGVGVDGDGCIWNADTNASGQMYKFSQAGNNKTPAEFATPSDFPWGVDFDSFDALWHADRTTDTVYEIAPDNRARAQGTKPTLSVTANSVDPSNSVSAQGTKPTMDSTPRTAHSNLSHVGTAQNPTMTATAKSATGSALANATASKPTASATTRTGAGYADVPLIDGELIDEDTGQIYRWDELELAIRCDKATLDAIIRPLEQEAGEFEKNDTPDGGFVTQDSADGGNTYRYSPRYAEYPVAINQQILVDTYTESPASKDFGEFRVRVVFKLDQNRPTESNDISESVGTSDWAFHFYSGTIATERVRRDVQAETQGKTLGFILNVFLDDSQAEALRKTTGRQGAVTTTGGSRGNVSAIDNAPNSENTLYLEPRDTKQISEGRYVLRSSELERLDPEGTFYRARLEIVPENRGAWGKLGAGKVGEFKHGEP